MTDCHSVRRGSGLAVPGSGAHLEPSGWPRLRPSPCRSRRCTCRCRRPRWSRRRSSERPLRGHCHTHEDTPCVREAQLPQLPAPGALPGVTVKWEIRSRRGVSSGRLVLVAHAGREWSLTGSVPNVRGLTTLAAGGPGARPTHARRSLPHL